jgi:hypothetical protein
MRIPAACLALVLVAGVVASNTRPTLANAAYDAGMSALSSTFSPRPGAPSGSYVCSTINVTWSGSGDHLKFSGQAFNTAQAQYGANRAGRSSIRFVWNPKTQPTVWICTR